MNCQQINAATCKQDTICAYCDYNYTECLACAYTYVNQPNKGTCVQSCDVGQQVVLGNYKGYQQEYCAYDFDVNCKKIYPDKDYYVCQECMLGYFLDLSSGQVKCSQCPTGCNKCSSSTDPYCRYCLEGYFLDFDQNLCFDCDQNCSLCSSEKCFECKVGYKMYGKKCLKCPPGQFWENQTCVNCVQNCEQCSEKDKCEVCYSGYFIQDGKCVQECSQNYRLSSNGKECIQCIGCKECFEDSIDICQSCFDGKYLSNTQKCEQCNIPLSNCLKCSDSKTCLSCQPPFSPIKQIDGSVTCSQCQTNQLLIGDTCQVCGSEDLPDYNSDCSEKCGDGKRTTDQLECDDGNKINGDGCSSSCKIEQGFTCSGGSSTSKDICKELKIDKKDLTFHITVDGKYICDQTHVYLIFNRNIQQPTEKVSIKIEISDVTQDDYSYDLDFDVSNKQYQITFKDVKFKSTSEKQIKVKILTEIFDMNGNSLSDSEQSGIFPQTLYITEEQKQQAEAAQQVGQNVVNTMLTSSLVVVLSGNFYLIVNIIDISEIIYFLLFINTKYPFNLEIYFRIFKNFQLSFLPDFFYWMKLQEGQDSPKKFSEEGMGSFFLSNIGESITCLIIVLCLYILTAIIGMRVQLFAKIRKTFELNRFLEAIWTVYLNIAISCFLQFQHIQSDGGIKNIFNLILCFFCFVFFMGCPIYFNYLVLSKRFEKDDVLQEKYGTLWDGMHMKTKISKSFNIILYYRKIYFALVIVFLYNYTNIQIGMLCLHNFILANIIIMKKPALHLKENLKNFLSEVFLFIGEVFIYQMHNMKEEGDLLESEEKIMLGWIVISLLSMILLIHFICVVFDTFNIVIIEIQKFRNKNKLIQVVNEKNFIVKKKKIKMDQNISKISNFKDEEDKNKESFNEQQYNQSPSNSVNIMNFQMLQSKSTKDNLLLNNDLNVKISKSQENEINGESEITKIQIKNTRNRAESTESTMICVIKSKQNQYDLKVDFDSSKNLNSVNASNLNQSNQNFSINCVQNPNYEAMTNGTTPNNINCSINDQMSSFKDYNSFTKFEAANFQSSEEIFFNPRRRKNRHSVFNKGKQRKMTTHIGKIQKSVACIDNNDNIEELEYSQRKKNKTVSNIENKYINDNDSKDEIKIHQQKSPTPKIVISQIDSNSSTPIQKPIEDMGSFSIHMTNSGSNLNIVYPDAIKENLDAPPILLYRLKKGVKS